MRSRSPGFRIDRQVHKIGVFIIAMLAAAYLEMFLEVVHADRTHMRSDPNIDPLAHQWLFVGIHVQLYWRRAP